MLEALGGALQGVVDGASSELADAAASGDAARFQVDLQALNTYFFKIYDTLDNVSQHAQRLPSDEFDRACVNTGEIPGVSAAIESTVNGAFSAQSDSMRMSLMNLRGLLAKHLTAIQHVYNAYVTTDIEGASELTQASNPKASGINVSLPGNEVVGRNFNVASPG